MLVVERRCVSAEQSDAVLELPFELRQKSRLRTRLASGEDVGLFLERGSTLRDGDLLLANDGRVIRVRAQPEAVYRVTARSPLDLLRAAFHLGNRHVVVEIGEGWLRLTRDAVLRDMLEKLGLTVTEEYAAFEPERGAYAQHAHEPVAEDSARGRT